MHLGIDHQTGHVYEGIGSPATPVIPTPQVAHAQILDAAGDLASLPSSLFGTSRTWVFREDSFDPVTRTRRGRLYKPQGSTQPETIVAAPHPYDRGVPSYSRPGPSVGEQKTLYTFVAALELLERPHAGVGSTLALGSSRASSIWRIIQAEVLVSGSVLVTLKSLSAFGLVPELDLARVPDAGKKVVSQDMERVLNSAFRETPISVIDHVRNAMASIIGHWRVDALKAEPRASMDELGQHARAIMEGHSALANQAAWVAKMHSRGKSNEQAKHGLDAPVEEDAELALCALGFTLRHVGWAKS